MSAENVIFYVINGTTKIQFYEGMIYQYSKKKAICIKNNQFLIKVHILVYPYWIEQKNVILKWCFLLVTSTIAVDM